MEKGLGKTLTKKIQGMGCRGMGRGSGPRDVAMEQQENTRPAGSGRGHSPPPGGGFQKSLHAPRE